MGPLQCSGGAEIALDKLALRGYRTSDLGAIFALDQICFAAPFRFSQRAMGQFAESRNALTVIAEDETTGEIAGFCIAHVERMGEQRVGYLVTLDVASEWRRRGLARAMIDCIEQKVRAAGCSAMELHVSVENDGAIAFYEREGYARVGSVGSFYGTGRDACVYRKELPAIQNLNR